MGKHNRRKKFRQKLAISILELLAAMFAALTAIIQLLMDE